jgi:sRNA-binding regulator protein Hfq
MEVGDFGELEWQIDNLQDEFRDDLRERKESLSRKTDCEILRIAIMCGTKLNEVTEHFPAYDVALKIQNHNWVPTEKQRKAIINVTAYWQTKQKFNRRYGFL